MITDYSCPKCGGEMKIRAGSYGTFLGCANYPDCRGTRNITGCEIPAVKKFFSEMKKNAKDEKFNQFVQDVEDRLFVFKVQTDRMTSHHGSGGLTNMDEDKIWVTNVTAKHLKFLNIPVIQKMNRYGKWYYQVARDEVDGKYPWTSAYDATKEIHVPQSEEYSGDWFIETFISTTEIFRDGEIVGEWTVWRKTTQTSVEFFAERILENEEAKIFPLEGATPQNLHKVFREIRKVNHDAGGDY